MEALAMSSAMPTGGSGCSPAVRGPLALCYEEGLSQREAAEVLELPESTVSKRVNEGLARLRDSLRDSANGPKSTIPVGQDGIAVFHPRAISASDNYMMVFSNWEEWVSVLRMGMTRL